MCEYKELYTADGIPVMVKTKQFPLIDNSNFYKEVLKPLGYSYKQVVLLYLWKWWSEEGRDEKVFIFSSNMVAKSIKDWWGVVISESVIRVAMHDLVAIGFLVRIDKIQYKKTERFDRYFDYFL